MGKKGKQKKRAIQNAKINSTTKHIKGRTAAFQDVSLLKDMNEKQGSYLVPKHAWLQSMKKEEMKFPHPDLFFPGEMKFRDTFGRCDPMKKKLPPLSQLLKRDLFDANETETPKEPSPNRQLTSAEERFLCYNEAMESDGVAFDRKRLQEMESSALDLAEDEKMDVVSETLPIPFTLRRGSMASTHGFRRDSLSTRRSSLGSLFTRQSSQRSLGSQFTRQSSMRSIDSRASIGSAASYNSYDPIHMYQHPNDLRRGDDLDSSHASYTSLESPSTNRDVRPVAGDGPTIRDLYGEYGDDSRGRNWQQRCDMDDLTQQELMEVEVGVTEARRMRRIRKKEAIRQISEEEDEEYDSDGYSAHSKHSSAFSSRSKQSTSTSSHSQPIRPMRPIPAPPLLHPAAAETPVAGNHRKMVDDSEAQEYDNDDDDDDSVSQSVVSVSDAGSYSSSSSWTSVSYYSHSRHSSATSGQVASLHSYPRRRSLGSATSSSSFTPNRKKRHRRSDSDSELYSTPSNEVYSGHSNDCASSMFAESHEDSAGSELLDIAHAMQDTSMFDGGLEPTRGSFVVSNLGQSAASIEMRTDAIFMDNSDRSEDVVASLEAIKPLGVPRASRVSTGDSSDLKPAPKENYLAEIPTTGKPKSDALALSGVPGTVPREFNVATTESLPLDTPSLKEMEARQSESHAIENAAGGIPSAASKLNDSHQNSFSESPTTAEGSQPEISLLKIPPGNSSKRDSSKESLTKGKNEQKTFPPEKSREAPIQSSLSAQPVAEDSTRGPSSAGGKESTVKAAPPTPLRSQQDISVVEEANPADVPRHQLPSDGSRMKVFLPAPVREDTMDVSPHELKDPPNDINAVQESSGDSSVIASSLKINPLAASKDDTREFSPSEISESKDLTSEITTVGKSVVEDHPVIIASTLTHSRGRADGVSASQEKSPDIHTQDSEIEAASLPVKENPANASGGAAIGMSAVLLTALQDSLEESPANAASDTGDSSPSRSIGNDDDIGALPVSFPRRRIKGRSKSTMNIVESRPDLPGRSVSFSKVGDAKEKKKLPRGVAQLPSWWVESVPHMKTETPNEGKRKPSTTKRASISEKTDVGSGSEVGDVSLARVTPKEATPIDADTAHTQSTITAPLSVEQGSALDPASQSSFHAPLLKGPEQECVDVRPEKPPIRDSPTFEKKPVVVAQALAVSLENPYLDQDASLGPISDGGATRPDTSNLESKSSRGLQSGLLEGGATEATLARSSPQTVDVKPRHEAIVANLPGDAVPVLQLKDHDDPEKSGEHDSAFMGSTDGLMGSTDSFSVGAESSAGGSSAGLNTNDLHIHDLTHSSVRRGGASGSIDPKKGDESCELSPNSSHTGWDYPDLNASDPTLDEGTTHPDTPTLEHDSPRGLQPGLLEGLATGATLARSSSQPVDVELRYEESVADLHGNAVSVAQTTATIAQSIPHLENMRADDDMPYLEPAGMKPLPESRVALNDTPQQTAASAEQRESEEHAGAVGPNKGTADLAEIEKQKMVQDVQRIDGDRLGASPFDGITFSSPSIQESTTSIAGNVRNGKLTESSDADTERAQEEKRGEDLFEMIVGKSTGLSHPEKHKQQETADSDLFSGPVNGVSFFSSNSEVSLKDIATKDNEATQLSADHSNVQDDSPLVGLSPSLVDGSDDGFPDDLRSRWKHSTATEDEIIVPVPNNANENANDANKGRSACIEEEEGSAKAKATTRDMTAEDKHALSSTSQLKDTPGKESSRWVIKSSEWQPTPEGKKKAAEESQNRRRRGSLGQRIKLSLADEARETHVRKNAMAENSFRTKKGASSSAVGLALGSQSEGSRRKGWGRAPSEASQGSKTPWYKGFMIWKKHTAEKFDEGSGKVWDSGDDSVSGQSETASLADNKLGFSAKKMWRGDRDGDEPAQRRSSWSASSGGPSIMGDGDSDSDLDFGGLSKRSRGARRLSKRISHSSQASNTALDLDEFLETGGLPSGLVVESDKDKGPPSLADASDSFNLSSALLDGEYESSALEDKSMARTEEETSPNASEVVIVEEPDVFQELENVAQSIQSARLQIDSPPKKENLEDCAPQGDAIERPETISEIPVKASWAALESINVKPISETEQVDSLLHRQQDDASVEEWTIPLKDIEREPELKTPPVDYPDKGSFVNASDVIVIPLKDHSTPTGDEAASKPRLKRSLSTDTLESWVPPESIEERRKHRELVKAKPEKVEKWKKMIARPKDILFREKKTTLDDSFDDDAERVVASESVSDGLTPVVADSKRSAEISDNKNKRRSSKASKKNAEETLANRSFTVKKANASLMSWFTSVEGALGTKKSKKTKPPQMSLHERNRSRETLPVLFDAPTPMDDVDFADDDSSVSDLSAAERVAMENALEELHAPRRESFLSEDDFSVEIRLSLAPKASREEILESLVDDSSVISYLEDDDDDDDEEEEEDAGAVSKQSSGATSRSAASLHSEFTC